MEKYNFTEDMKKEFVEFAKSIDEFIEESLTVEHLDNVFNSQGYFSGVYHNIYFDSESNIFYEEEK